MSARTASALADQLDADPSLPGRGSNSVRTGYRAVVFFFFSNRLGCLGSLLLSVVVTVLLLLAFGVL